MVSSNSKTFNHNLWNIKLKEKGKLKDIFLKAKEEDVVLVEILPLVQAFGFQVKINNINREIIIEQKEGEDLSCLIDSNAQEILRYIDKNEKEIIDTSLNIHRYAEKGNQEFKSSQLLVDKLKKHGFEVEHGLDGIKSGKVVKMDTAFKAILRGKSQGPTIYIMLEYDALPIGHACGHNLIASSGLAAAIGLSKLMTEIPGTLVVIGTPAEDGGDIRGKEPLLKRGHFQGADIVFITHPGNFWTDYASFLAVNGGIITYQGVPSHAAVAPDKGINALKAAYLTLNAIDALREHILPESRIHAIISEGGMAPNIVPEKARIDIRVRSTNTTYIIDLMEKIERAAKGASYAMGVQVNISWRGIQPSSINVLSLNELILSNVEYFKVTPVIRKEKIIGSSDLSFISQEVPTVNLFFKISDTAALHTYEFMKAAASPEGQEAMLISGKVLALSAYQLFVNPEKVKEIIREFKMIKNI